MIATLKAVCRPEQDSVIIHPPLEAFFEGDRILQQNTEDLPSRAEITDAAMSERAECVMLK